MMFVQTITRAQREYVLAHVNDRPRAEYIRRSGLSPSTFYRIAREAGCEMRHDLSEKPEGIEFIITVYYPTMSAAEICKKFGFRCRHRINTWAKRLGVRHTPETARRIHDSMIQGMREGAKKIDHMKVARKRQAKRRIDEYRMWEGKPQLTNFRLRRMTQKAYKAKWYLMRRYGYLDDENDAYLLIAPPDNGRRCLRERYYTERYRLKFTADSADEEEHITDNDDKTVNQDENKGKNSKKP